MALSKVSSIAMLYDVDLESALESEDYLSILIKTIQSETIKQESELKVKNRLFFYIILLLKIYLKCWNVDVLEVMKNEIKLLKEIFAVKELSDLMKKWEEKEKTFKYSLEIAVVDTQNTRCLQLKGDDCLFLVSSNKNFFFYQTIKFEHLVEKGKWIAKDGNKILIHLSNSNIENNKSIQLELLAIKNVKNPKLLRAILELGFNCSSFKIKTIGKFAINPKQIHPEGFNQWIFFGGNIKLKIHMIWRMNRIFNVNSSRIFQISAINHSLILYEFLRYRSDLTGKETTKYVCINHLDVQTKNTNDQPAFINLNQLTCFIHDKIGRTNDLQIRNTIDGFDPLTNQMFCIGSEWCNLNAFYYKNELFRMILCLNHNFSQIPDQLIVPIHFRETCKLIGKDKIPCFGLLSSAFSYLKHYLNPKISQQITYHLLTTTTEGKILNQAYFWLRNCLSHEMFLEANGPILSSFGIYSEVLMYFRSYLTISDSFLPIYLRILFFKTLRYWVIFVLNGTLKLTPEQMTLNLFEDTNQTSNINCPVRLSQHLYLILRVRNILTINESELPLCQNESDAKCIILKFLIGFNRLFIKYSQITTFNFILESNQNDQMKNFQTLMCILRIYSWAYYIQQEHLSLILFYFKKEEKFRIFINRLGRFFFKNHWIESISKNVLSITIFRNSEGRKKLKESFDKFQAYWGINDEMKVINEEERVTSLLFRYAVLKEWYETDKSNHAIVFTAIITSLENWLDQLSDNCNHLMEYIRQFLQNSNSDHQSIRLQLEHCFAKAISYNLICYALYFVRRVLHFLEEKQSANFVTLFPGWYKLIKAHLIFTDKIADMRKLFAFNKDKMIHNVLVKTQEQIKACFKIIYINLTILWLNEMKYYGKWSKRGRFTLFKNKLEFIHVLYGFAIIRHFAPTFPNHYLTTRELLSDFIYEHEYTQQKAYFDIINDCINDKNALLVENPFATTAWTYFINELELMDKCNQTIAETKQKLKQPNISIMNLIDAAIKNA